MNEIDLVDQAINLLVELGVGVVAQKPPRGARQPRADAWMRIGRGRERIDYVVEAKRAVTPTTLGATVAHLRHLATTAGRPALLVTDYLTPPVANMLRTQEQQFADTAGNAYLKGPGLLVYVTGQKPQDEPTARQGDRAFTANGLKVLFALLCDPQLADAPYRIIATAAGVALGTIPAVLGSLKQKGHLLETQKRRRLHATRRLLDEWALAYARQLRPRTLLATYTTPTFDHWRKWGLAQEQARWGGEPAAALLVGHLKPGALTIYAAKRPPKLLIEQRMVTAGPEVTERMVEIRAPFWGPTLNGETHPDIVLPVLVYADLLATGDGRCIETAQMVYDGHLARLLAAR